MSALAPDPAPVQPCPAMSNVIVPGNHVGPPTMGHGGYVAGLLAREVLRARDGAVQITLRRPTPVDHELEVLDAGTDRWELRDGDDLIAEAEPSTLDLEIPPVPGVDDARAAEAGSPSRWEGRGVHPVCLGCGLARTDDEGLEIGVGPLVVDGHEQVAAAWRPKQAHAGRDGTVDPLWVLAALDCPGAMAFIARGTSAGLLGRIVFEQRAPVTLAEDHVVLGWQIGTEGRKLFAGTALASAEGRVLAAARATWFGRG